MRFEQDVLNVNSSCLSLKDQAETWETQLKTTCPDALHTLIPDGSSILHANGTDIIFLERYESASVDIEDVYML